MSIKRQIYTIDCPELIGLYDKCGGRVINCLLSEGLVTKELIINNSTVLEKIPNMGKKSIKDITDYFNITVTTRQEDEKISKYKRFLESKGFVVSHNAEEFKIKYPKGE